jgi:S-adenosylmethionine-dependent methyltransferase
MTSPAQYGNELTASIYTRYQQSAASRLRYYQAQQNLQQLHQLNHSLRILDAAGGNGLNTAFLLNRGHTVTLFDADPNMLAQAREWLAGTDWQDRCRLVEGRLETIGTQLAGEDYDLILCHHVVEYLEDCQQVLGALKTLTAAGGDLSLITLNPVSEVMRGVIFRKDPALSHAKLNDMSYDAKWFGKARLYTFDQVVTWAEQGGWSLKDFRAIRVLADYLPEADLNAERERALLALEETLAGLEPYRRCGRYFQFGFSNRLAA